MLFAHGSGSSRLSPRNLSVGRKLNTGGLATLLFNLLTPDEALTHARVLDIDLLTARLVGATHWLGSRPDLAHLRVGYFGASAGAALRAAGLLRGGIGAIVSRDGRPDHNDRARRQLQCPNQLAIVPGATHLFEEPWALEQVALARDWFVHHLTGTRRTA